MDVVPRRVYILVSLSRSPYGGDLPARSSHTPGSFYMQRPYVLALGNYSIGLVQFLVHIPSYIPIRPQGRRTVFVEGGSPYLLW